MAARNPRSPRALRPAGDARGDADRLGEGREARLPVADVKDRLHVTDEELRDDIDLLNVVNFGGGTYVLYAELQGDEIEVDAEPYGDNFARPARLLPLEAKALVAAIDLFGDHLPQSGLASARKIVKALGRPLQEGLEIAASGGDDSDVARRVNKAIGAQRVLRDPLLQGERGRVHQAGDRAVPAREWAGGLVRRLLRQAPRGHPPLPPRPDQGGRDLGRLRAAAGGRGDRRDRGGAWLSGRTFPPPTSPGSGSPLSAPAVGEEEHTVTEESSAGGA